MLGEHSKAAEASKQEKEMTEPKKMTFHAYVEELGIPIEKAMELAKFVRSAMREDLVKWLNAPEIWESNS